MDGSLNNLPRGGKNMVAGNIGKTFDDSAIDDDTPNDAWEDGSPNSKRSKDEDGSEDGNQNEGSSSIHKKPPSFDGGSPIASSTHTAEGGGAEDLGSVYFISPNSEGAMAHSKKISRHIAISSEATANGISFTITTSGRFKTSLGGKHQGDHVTAYATFIELIYNATHERSPREIVNLMQKLVEAVIDEGGADFEESRAKFFADSEDIVSRDERKEITAKLRRDEAPLEKISRLKNSFKLAENALIGQFIASTATTFIEKLNGLEGMAYEADETIDKDEKAKKRGAQGSVIKKAIYCVSLINLIQKMNADDPEELSELIDSFRKKSSSSKQGLKEVIKFLNPKQDEEQLAKQTIQAIEEKSTSPKSLIENNDKVAALIGRKVADLFDFRYEQGRQIDALFKHMARHLAIVFNTFEGLQPYLKNQETYAIFLSNFIKGAALEKSWNEYQKIDDSMLSESDIAEGIEKNFNFNTCKTNPSVRLSSAMLQKLNAEAQKSDKDDTSKAKTTLLRQ